MQLTQADDLDDTADIFCSGIAAIEEVAPDARGNRRRVVDCQVWSTPQLADTLLVIQKALKEMRAMRGQPKLVQAAGMH